jgi:hypothetical protein
MYVPIACIILLAIVIWVHYRTEPFLAGPSATLPPPIDPKLVTAYQQFATTVYNPFLVTWQKAIVSSISADQPQKPLTSPSQASSSSATPTIPPQSEMNSYIANLSQKLGKPLPNITDPLPDTIDIVTFSTIAPKIPADPVPYTNALTWINQQLTEAQLKLQSALKGESFMNLEGFDNQTCQDLSKCFEDNPELIRQCGEAMKKQGKMDQSQVLNQLKQFMKNKEFVNAYKTNKELVEQSKKIESDAKSGALLNQMNLPTEPGIKYTLPGGSDKLQKMDYAQQKAVKEAAPSMFSLKTMMDQINANLR